MFNLSITIFEIPLYFDIFTNSVNLILLNYISGISDNIVFGEAVCLDAEAAPPGMAKPPEAVVAASGGKKGRNLGYLLLR